MLETKGNEGKRQVDTKLRLNLFKFFIGKPK